MYATAKHNWTTDEGIAAGVRDQLKLKGYGTAFQIYQGRTLLDEDAARQAVIDAVTAPTVTERHHETLRRMIAKDEDIDMYDVEVQVDPEGNLVFEHGDLVGMPIDLADGLSIAGPGRKTRQQRQIEDRAKALDQKRRRIQGTSEEDYLTHAHQCGYLLRNVRLDFLRSPKMQGTSVKMRVRNLTLDQLRRFIDATGSPTLAGLSTHKDTQLGSDKSGNYIYSGWIGFALEIIDFLNLEFVIDIEELKAQHRDIGGDTGFRTLERWDADAEAVIGQLINRRSGIDADTIREWFAEGYGGDLIMDDAGRQPTA